MKLMTRLSIGAVQIWFDSEGAPRFSDANKRDRAGVESALSEYQEFIDRWREASEDLRPRRIGTEELERRIFLKSVAKSLRALLDKRAIEVVLRKCIEIRPEFAGFSREQIEDSIADAMSAL
jgi:hypothetical protein